VRLRGRIRLADNQASELKALEDDVLRFTERPDEGETFLARGNETYVGRHNRPREDYTGSSVHVSVVLRSAFSPSFSDLDDDDTETTTPFSSALSSDSRLVFVENLPGDVTAAALDGAFEKVGEIESAEFFNVPDDEVLAAALQAKIAKQDQAKEKKKNWKKRTRAGYNLRESGPDRSPTCALLQFKTDEGAKRATDPSLAVFGVVFAQRPCRTRPAKDLTSIYLSNLAPGLLEDALLDFLQDALRVDASQLQLWRRDPFTQPSRARLRFQSFREARWAWDRLQDALVDRKLQVEEEIQRRDELQRGMQQQAQVALEGLDGPNDVVEPGGAVVVVTAPPPEDPATLESLTKKDLIALCKGKGLTVYGNKADLVNRLRRAAEDAGPPQQEDSEPLDDESAVAAKAAREEEVARARARLEAAEARKRHKLRTPPFVLSWTPPALERGNL